jgi:hypothetical protein
MRNITNLIKEPETVQLTIIEFINKLQKLTNRNGYADIIKYVEYLHYCYIQEYTSEPIPDYEYLNFDAL